MKRPVAVLLGLVLSGCSTLPLPTLDLVLPDTWQNASRATAAPADLKGWWQAFQDPMLDARISAALDGNFGLREATERLRAARLLQDHASDAFRPAVRFHAGDEVAAAATASYFISSLDAGWEFGVFGRREGRRRELDGAADDAVAEFDGARVSLVAEVVADHLRLEAAKERAALLEQVAAVRTRQQSLAQRRHGLELGTADEVDAVAIEGLRANGELAASRRQVLDSARQLSALLGKARPDDALLNDSDLPTLHGTPPTTTPADLLRTRPEIRRAEAAVLQAAGLRDVSRADRFPNLGLMGSIRWSTTMLSVTRRATTNTIESVGPLIDIPLFDWGLRRARADSQSHLLAASVHAYRDAVLRGYVEAESALGALQGATEQLAAATEALTLRQRAADAAGKRIALKLASELEATGPALALLDARLALVDARATQGLAYVTLYKALGGAGLPAAAKAP